MSLEQLGISNFVENSKLYSPEFDQNQEKLLVPYGIGYLDRMLLGVMPDDLALIGAPPGVGKSELALQIAINAAAQGKRVVPFALEAHKGEWELRTKFRLYSHAICAQENPSEMARWTYIDFKMGRMAKKLEKYRKQVEEVMAGFSSLSVFYRGRDFGILDFRRIFNGLEGKADLIVVDHLHYFDTTTENENREFSQIMKTIKDMVDVVGIPVVLVGHLRKPGIQNGKTPLVADLYDFHGTSNISKIATTIVTIAPGPEVEENSGKYATYFRIAKSRFDGQVKRFIGQGVFDVRTNSYSDKYILGKLSQDQSEFEMIPENKHPLWYRERK